MPRWARVVGVVALMLAVPLVWALTPASSWVLQAIEALRAAGPAGMVAFGAMVVVSGPVIFSAELVMAASGFLYGPWTGFLLAWVCVHGAALANLALARTLLRERLRERFAGGALDQVDDLLEERGLLVVALLRLPPLSPFHVVSYMLGLTPVRVRDAMLGTALGAIPQVALFAWLGSTVGDISNLAHANEALSPALWAAIAVATVGVTVALTVLAQRQLRTVSGGRLGGVAHNPTRRLTLRVPGAPMTLSEQLAAPDATIDRIGAWLDAMDHAGRMEAMAHTSRAEQARLYELAAASAPLTLHDFVPASVPDRTEVIHHGRNSLPAFRMFQKRFARAPGDPSRAFGYNEGGTRWLIGPGYFVAHATAGNAAWEERGAVVVDYFMVPDAGVPDGWPTVVPNSRGLQVLVYHHTRDFMRRVSAHVTIGKAFKNETSMESFFTLVREDKA